MVVNRGRHLAGQHVVEDEHTKGECGLDADEKVTVEKLNDALVVVAMLSAKLRRQIDDSSRDAGDLEVATWTASASIGRLRKGA